ncbi:MAG: prepilin-type N-terminal cleavage/methylation domain-containing protein [Clostridia bacterium]|nr:prepilin-type N-terminal cleavage/methylation domain-containing protein [Clostridia bacterium]
MKNVAKTERRRNQEHNGFTLMELMIVLAIMSILFAIAIPGSIALQKNLEISRLDSYAKDIYLSVSDRIASMKASGELTTFQGTMYNDYESHNYEQISVPGGGVGFCPQDWEDKDGNLAYKRFFYLVHAQAGDGSGVVTDEAMYSLVPKVSVTQAYLGGFYLIELDPSNGNVYGVFYSEKAIDFEDIYNLGEYGETARSRENRKSSMIGYYNGYSDLLTKQELTEYQVHLDFVNKEDLYLQVQCDIADTYFSRDDI